MRSAYVEGLEQAELTDGARAQSSVGLCGRGGQVLGTGITRDGGWGEALEVDGTV